MPRGESLAKCHPSARGGDGVAPVAPGQTSEECCTCWLLAAKAEFRVEAPRNWGKDLKRAVGNTHTFFPKMLKRQDY